MQRYPVTFEKEFSLESNRNNGNMKTNGEKQMKQIPVTKGTNGRTKK